MEENLAAPALSILRMSGLLSEGLRVRHIEHLGLMTCKSTDDTDEVLNRPELELLGILGGLALEESLEQ